MTMLTESSVRSRAKRRGYIIHKSRRWKHVPNLDNFGDYMLVDLWSNFVVFGERFDATLEQIDAYLKEGEDMKGQLPPAIA